jgi:hypothetical protein
MHVYHSTVSILKINYHIFLVMCHLLSFLYLFLYASNLKLYNNTMTHCCGGLGVLVL